MIVDPWLFYLMSFCDSLKFFLIAIGFILSALGLFSLCVFGIQALDRCAISDDDILWKMCRTAFITLLIGITILWIQVFIPKSETVLLMGAAKIAKVDNVNMIFEALKDAADYVMQAMQ